MKSTAAALLVTFFLSPLAYGQPIPVRTCGTALNVKGGEYILTRDIGPCAGNGVNITADNVKFDLNGFTITGSGGSIGIKVIASGADISGGTVSSFTRGVSIYEGSRNHVHDMNVTRNRRGIELRSSDNNHINNNTVAYNVGGFDEYGVDLISSDKNHFKGNSIDGSFSSNVHLFDSHCNVFNGNESVNSIVRDGFELVESDNNVFTSNRASSNDGYGFFLRRSSANNSLRDNVANSNFYSGIVLSRSSCNTIQDNTANGNRLQGIYLFRCDYTTVKGNTANWSFLDNGIELYDCSWNLVKANWAMDNGGFDLSDNNCPENFWKNNRFGSSSGFCIE